MSELMKRRSLVLLGLACWGGPALALRYEDQDFDDTLALGGSTLVLNGIGKRAGGIWRAYVAGLYIGSKSTLATAVLAAPGAKRLQIRITLDVNKSLPLALPSIDAQEFVKAVNKGVARNCSEAEQAALGERLAQFTQNLQSVNKVRKKDVINIDYLPERGTLLAVNGRTFGAAVPGADLYGAFLKVFLGEQPFDAKLKAGLLGEAPAK